MKTNIKNDQSFNTGIEFKEDEIHKELDFAIEEHKKVKRLIDLFVLGLFLTFIIYTFI